MDWRSHPGVFAMCVVRVPADDLQPGLHDFRQVLAAFPFARVHPDHFLHIMLQELGFVCEKPNRHDEIDQARLDEFVTAARGPISEHPPFEIKLGGANSFQDAAFLDVHDAARCARLHTRLRDLAAVRSIPRYAYLPHTTVAHYTSDTPVGRLPGIIARWRDHHFGAFTVSQIDIVTLRVNEPYPPLETLAAIPLRG